MTDIDRLWSDANAKVERWMLAQFRIAYRAWTGVEPLGRVRAHMLRCPEATCGPVAGGEEDISSVTAGGLVDLEAEISCPHGDRYWYRYHNYGDLAGILADLDDPSWQEVGPLPELPSHLDLWCPTCLTTVERHSIDAEVMSATNAHEHAVHVVVVREGVEKDRQFVASGERWRVELP